MNDSLETKYPKLFQIVLQLRAPENATEDDVKRVMRQHLLPAKIISIEELKNDNKP